MLHFLATRQAAIFAVLLVVFSLAATQLPLLHTLGYEFAVAAGLLAGIAGGFCALPLWQRENASASEGDAAGAWRGYLRRFARILLALEFVLALPAAIMTVNALLVPNCAPLEGALFFLLIPVPALLFAVAAAALCASLFRSRAAYAAYAGIVALLLLHPFVQTLTQPQLFAFNQFFGLFVGFSWDEAQPALGTLALYRVTTLAWSFALLATAFVLTPAGRASRRAPEGVRPVFALFAVSAAVVFLGIAFSDDAGFSTSARALAAALPETRQTAHFTIHAAAGAFTQAEFDEIAEEHEFRLAQVCRVLRVEWKSRITSYLYPDARSKKRLLGTESSQIARPWLREIHLSKDGWREAVKHEIAHVVASAFGPWPLRVPVLRELGLTEGLAMAVEWNAGNRTPHEYAAGMLAQGLLPSTEQFLGTPGFITGASFSGYIASGSFCSWLMDAKGIDALKRAYTADDATAATGATGAQLETQWRAFLRTVPAAAADSAVTFWLFRRQTLFSKVCPRAVTEKNREASAALRGGAFDAAAALFRESDAMAPNGSAVYGLCNAYLALARHDSVLAVTRRVLADARRASSLLPLWLWRGDAARASGDTATAAACYRTLLAARPGGWTEDDAREKLAALSAPPQVRDLLLRYYALQPRSGARADSLRDAGTVLLRAAFAADSAVPVTRLLLARALALDSSRQSEAALLCSGARPGEFLYECGMRAGDLLYRSGARDAAERQYARALAASATEMQRVEARDALERIAWRRARR